MLPVWTVLIAAGFLVAVSAFAEPGPAETTVADFAQRGEAGEWIVVNDGVMGGLSSSRLVAASDSTALFAGTLSLENNGGFASVRRLVETPLPRETSALAIHVRGDGRRYQFRLRTDDRMDGVAYRAEFTTTDGEWETIELPLDTFVASFRGRRVPNAPALDPARIRQLGLLIGDKRPGAFALEVRHFGAHTGSSTAG